jgi:hypothetical protein
MLRFSAGRQVIMYGEAMHWFDDLQDCDPSTYTIG